MLTINSACIGAPTQAALAFEKGGMMLRSKVARRHKGGSGRAKSGDRGHLPAEALLYDDLVGAIVDQRLRAGTRLNEANLAKAYGLTRPRVRSVLNKLATNNIIEIKLNLGAFVRRPSPEEARPRQEMRPARPPRLRRDCGYRAKARSRRRQSRPTSRRQPADARDEHSVEAAIAGVDGVVNAISMYVEHGSDTFHSVQRAVATDQIRS
jgi:hypothetical protein